MSAKCEGCNAKDDNNKRLIRRFHAVEKKCLALGAEIARLKLTIYLKEHDDKEHQFWLERKVHSQRQEINRLLKLGIVKQPQPVIDEARDERRY